MIRFAPVTAAALAAAFVAATGPAAAAEVYRWIDADGVVHFSDTRPGERPVETLTVRDTTPADYDPESDPYSVLNQAERLKENRARLETEREDREQRRREQTERIVVYERDRGFRQSLYFGPWFPPLAVPGFRPVDQRRVAGQQARALEETGLAAPRPASINSGGHRQRVEQSRSLPLAGGRAPQRFR